MKKFYAFTLAEVLITLGVIGVVSAMTMPVLINKVKDKEYDRAREKALASIGEAGRLLAVQGDIGSASNAEDFVKNYLSKKLKIVKTCDSTKLLECGLSSAIKKSDGTTTIEMPTTFADLGLPQLSSRSTWYPIKNKPSYGFVTVNGYSINLFYNPDCITDTNEQNAGASGYACFNAIYDMNGQKNPNQVGKDIGFVTVLYPNETNRAVAPNPNLKAIGNYSWYDAQAQCSNLGKEYTLPDKGELLAIAINRNLLNITGGGYCWASSTYPNLPNTAWSQAFSDGNSGYTTKNTTNGGLCIRR